MAGFKQAQAAPADGGGVSKVDTTTDTWSKVAFSGWMKTGEVFESREPIWRYASEYNDLICGKCHVAYPPKAFSADAWPGHMKDMKPYADLEKEPSRLLSAYLQYNAAGK